MLRLLKHTLLILVVFFVSFFAEAGGLGSFLGARESEAGPCNFKKREDLPAIEYHEIAKIAEQNKTAKSYCIAVQYFAEAKRQSNQSLEIMTYWISMIESYFFQYDYERFLEESFNFLDFYKQAPQAEYVNYLMLKAIAELSRKNTNMENPYLLYGLGASPEQFNQDSPKQVLKFRAFLDRYPNSVYKEEVFSWLNEAREYFNNDYANTTRMMVMKREYAPAISRFQFLLSQGPSLPQFTLIVFECIQAMNEFATNIMNENVVANAKLAHWLITTEDKVSISTRQLVQSKLQEQSHQLLKNLIEKFPDDPWSKKAVRKFGMP